MRTTRRDSMVICCVSLLMFLAGCATGRSSAAPPAATLTPTTDPATQAYVSALQQYYVPWLADEEAEKLACGEPTKLTTPAGIQNALASCQPYEVRSIAATQTLLDHLKTVTPPARWQKADEELKQALQETIAFHTQKLQAIAAHNGAKYFNVTLNVGPPLAMEFCDPINQFNAGPPPLSPPLEVIVPDLCTPAGGNDS